MVTLADVQDFARFAGDRLSRGDAASLTELAAAWEDERELRATMEGVRQSIADHAAGRVKPVAEAFASVRERTRLEPVSYKVHLTTAAELSLYEAALWWADHRNPAQAIAWLEGFEAAISSLSENPGRYGLASESPLFPFEMRQLLYGVGKKKTHRALFQVCDDEVVVHRIRGLAQKDVTPRDLGMRGV